MSTRVPRVIAALSRGGRLWKLPRLPALLEDLTLRLESRPSAAFPHFSHSALDVAARRPQPLGKPCGFSTAPTASTTTIHYHHLERRSQSPSRVRSSRTLDQPGLSLRSTRQSVHDRRNRCPRSSVSAVFIALPVALLLALAALAAFVWSVRSGQMDDLETPGYRVLVEEEGDGRRAEDGAEHLSFPEGSPDRFVANTQARESV